MSTTLTPPQQVNHCQLCSWNHCRNPPPPTPAHLAPRIRAAPQRCHQCPEVRPPKGLLLFQPRLKPGHRHVRHGPRRALGQPGAQRGHGGGLAVLIQLLLRYNKLNVYVILIFGVWLHLAALPSSFSSSCGTQGSKLKQVGSIYRFPIFNIGSCSGPCPCTLTPPGAIQSQGSVTFLLVPSPLDSLCRSTVRVE